jgi:hypothetical protein
MTTRKPLARHRCAGVSLSKGTIDGRTLVARRRRELIEVYARALGGASNLSEGQLVDIRKAAELTSLAERARARAMREGTTDSSDLSAMVRLESTASRAVRALNIPASSDQPRTPSPSEYLARRIARNADKRSGTLA